MMMFLIFTIVHAVQYKPQELHHNSAYDADQIHSVYEISLKKDLDFEDGSQYGYGFWCKFSMTGPTYLDQQYPWHSISRLSSRENHTDYENGEDRTLFITLGKGIIQFITYSIESDQNKYQNMDITLIDEWVFLYYCYSYDENLAQGFLINQNQELYSISIPAKHNELKYLNFMIKREFNKPVLNGFYSNIQLYVGEGYFNKHQLLKMISDKFRLNSFLFDLPQHQLLLNESSQVYYDKQKFNSFQFKEIQPTQYSVSGWLKWEIPLEEKDNNLIFRMSQRKEHKNDESYGDRLIYFSKQLEEYYLESYSCQKFNCEQVKWKTTLDDDQFQWHFVYIGYNMEISKLFQFQKYQSKAFVSHKQAFHYKSYGLYIQLQKDKYSIGYNGKFKQWVFNYGDGAYTENGFEKDKLLQNRLGIQFDIPLEEQIKYKFHEEEIPINQQIDPNLKNVNQYGYGFWFRYTYDDIEISTIGLSRLETNTNQQALTLILKPFKINIQTYSAIDKKEKVADIEMKYEGLWLYAYIGYMRYSDTNGIVVGCVFQQQNDRQCMQINNIVHYKIDHYLSFQIGKIADYQQFSGQIKQIRLNFGLNSFYPNLENMNKQQLSIIQQQKWILQQQTQYSGDYQDSLDKSPTELQLDDYIFQYGIEFWFKQEGLTKSERQFLIYLTQDQQFKLNTLSMSLDQQHNIQFYSYTLLPVLQQINQVQKIENSLDQLQWTYVYYFYDELCQYFIQTKTQKFKQQFNCQHHATNYLALFKGSDPLENQLFGKIDYLKLYIGENLRQFYYKSDVFEQGLKLFPTSFQWKKYFEGITPIDSKVVVINQEFKSTNQLSMEGQRNYGYGFWSRYLSTYPDQQEELQNTDISLAQLLINQKEALSVYLTFDKKNYKFKSYNLENNKYKFGEIKQTNIQEGIWNYIYISYNANSNQVVAFVHYYEEKKAIRLIINQLIHQPINNDASFRFGRYGINNGFKGQIANLLLSFDGDSFISDIQTFKKLVMISQLPFQSIEQHKQISLIQDSIIKPDIKQSIDIEFPTEYAVYGWFRPNELLIQAKEFKQQTIFKLFTINNNYPITSKLSPNGYVYNTYSINDQSPPNTWLTNIGLGSTFGSWTYFWIGYSKQQQQISLFTLDQHKKIELIEHYLENQYIIQLDQSFTGEMQQFGIALGKGSYLIDQFPEQEFKIQGRQLLFQQPGIINIKENDHLNILRNHSQLIGSIEYSVQIWSRWLHYYGKQIEQNILFRLARTKQYEDCANIGDKTLMVVIDHNSYIFQTYSGDDCQVEKNIIYSQNLEGSWNFVYFGYKDNLAKGYVYFSDTQKYYEVEQQVYHIPLASEAILNVGNQEFQYGKFIGQLSDLQITIGYGFVEDSTKLQIDPPLADKNSFVKHLLIDREQLLDPNDFTKFEIKPDFNDQYAVFGWFKNQGILEYGKYANLLRMKSNLESDLGDDTFLILINQKSMKMRSYNLQDYVNEGQITHSIEKVIDFVSDEATEWTFFYFGYSFKNKELSYLIKMRDGIEQKYTEQYVYHYMPFNLYINLCEDKQYSKFQGWIDDINIVVGESSYMNEGQYYQFGQLNQKYVQQSEQQQGIQA